MAMGNRTARNTGIPGTGVEAIGDKEKMSEEKEAILKERSEYSLRGWAMRFLRERDELQLQLEELDFLRYEGGEESIGREIEKAESRGYRRGVEDAIAAADREAANAMAEQDSAGLEVTGISWAVARRAIYAFLEQTSDSNSPHPKSGAGNEKKI
jgi:hypothetical protein